MHWRWSRSALLVKKSASHLTLTIVVTAIVTTPTLGGVNMPRNYSAWRMLLGQKTYSPSTLTPSSQIRDASSID
jgi:hypothetical protein